MQTIARGFTFAALLLACGVLKTPVSLAELSSERLRQEVVAQSGIGNVHRQFIDHLTRQRKLLIGFCQVILHSVELTQHQVNAPYAEPCAASLFDLARRLQIAPCCGQLCG